MKGGKEELSYVNNSKVQAKHANSMLHLLKETLDRVQLSSPEFLFLVADLGCSSGSNSINTVDLIIKHMTKRYDALGYDSPEFSAFFSDLPSNDFNTLFQLLLPLGNHGGSMEEALAVPESVLDKRSAAYNKGRVFIHGANESTANAYKKQFQTDLASFLRSRAKELKKGGSMFLA
ncbi:unnamed protein product [Prunus armeniaca]|uniref:Uncharacterized protein n=1 Tax=Prunus armeniaca TaxID=36596 RepID=A0A6J5X377_PRUAR|nr:unnamed protein product [Prunus armeniaca]